MPKGMNNIVRLIVPSAIAVLKAVRSALIDCARDMRFSSKNFLEA